MSANKQVLAALMIVSVILGIVVQFVPFHSFDFGGFSISATPWELEAMGQSESFYSDDAEGDGVGLIQTGTPILLVSIVAGLVGSILMFMGNAKAGLGTGALATLFGIVGLVLLAIGMDKFFDGNGDLAVGFYLAIAMVVLNLVATVMAGANRD